MNKSIKVFLPTRSQVRAIRVRIMDELYDKPSGMNLTMMTAIFNCSKKTTVGMFQDVKKLREARKNDQNQQ